MRRCLPRFMAVAILACLVGACSNSPGGGAGISATSLPAAPSPTAIPTHPTHFPAWSGAPGYPLFPSRLDAEFGWAEVGRNPYSLQGLNGHSTFQMHLYLTYDGGTSWVDRTPPNDGPYSFLYVGLHFADPLNVWFMENVFSSGDAMAGTELEEHWLYRTGDGGLTWTRYHLPLPPTYVATDLDMHDGVHGLITTAGNDQRQQLWGTNDGGATWTKLMDVLRDVNLTFPQSPTMVSADEGWALGMTDSGNGRVVMHSTDGGHSWKSSAPLPMPTGMVTLSWVKSASGWALPAHSGSGADLSIDGMAWTSGGWDYVTWVSHDAGATWAIGSTTPVGVGNLTFFSPRYIGLLTAGPTINYFDVDSPGSVAVFDGSGACRGTKMFFALASLATPDDAWGTCSYTTTEGFTDHSYLYGTRDGGLTWTPLMGAP